MNKIFITLIVVILLNSCNDFKKGETMKISWNTLSEMPPAIEDSVQYGLAGVLAGSFNGKIIIAGGSNFADKFPWLGGPKLYYDDIFILTSDKNDSLKWELPKAKLPYKMAYSASVSTKDAIYCFGGEDFTQPFKSAFKIYFENNRLQIKELPQLQFAVSNAGAAIIGSKIFVAGGNDSTGATKHFQMLNLSDTEKGWTVLPELPEAESHAVVVTQLDGKEDCIYVFGGRHKTGVTSTFLSNIQKYSPSENSWTKVGVLQIEGQKEFGLSAGTGIAFGKQYILLFGGDKGVNFNRTERFNNAIETETDSIKKQKTVTNKIKSLTNHPGFGKSILCFNTRTGKLEKLGEIPGLSQVTTTAFLWNGKVIIPGGEVRPGVRTSIIREATITLE